MRLTLPLLHLQALALLKLLALLRVHVAVLLKALRTAVGPVAFRSSVCEALRAHRARRSSDTAIGG